MEGILGEGSRARLRAGQLVNREETVTQIHSMLQRKGVVQLYAPPQSGKTTTCALVCKAAKQNPQGQSRQSPLSSSGPSAKNSLVFLILGAVENILLTGLLFFAISGLWHRRFTSFMLACYACLLCLGCMESNRKDPAGACLKFPPCIVAIFLWKDFVLQLCFKLTCR